MLMRSVNPSLSGPGRLAPDYWSTQPSAIETSPSRTPTVREVRRKPSGIRDTSSAVGGPGTEQSRIIAAEHAQRLRGDSRA